MNRFWAKDKERMWASKANNWSGRNFLRWQNAEFDKLFDQVLVETNAEKAAQLWHQLNDLVVKDYISVPLVNRKFTSGKSKQLQGPKLTAFDNETWNIGDWTKA
jgi:peptide/nickel transport system substrate-binding protein